MFRHRRGRRIGTHGHARTQHKEYNGVAEEKSDVASIVLEINFVWTTLENPSLHYL